MAHWGWYRKVKKRHIPRKLCSGLTFIDYFKLYKTNAMIRFTVQPLEVRAELFADHLKIIYRKRIDYIYTLKTTLK